MLRSSQLVIIGSIVVVLFLYILLMLAIHPRGETSSIQPPRIPTPDSSPILEVGTAEGNRGKTVRLPLFLDTKGQKIRSIQVNLGYNAAGLKNPKAESGSALPSSWRFASHSPGPGDTRMLAFDSPASAQDYDPKALEGIVFQLILTIGVDAPLGEIPFKVTSLDVRDSQNEALSIVTQSGAVVVQK